MIKITGVWKLFLFISSYFLKEAGKRDGRGGQRVSKLIIALKSSKSLVPASVTGPALS